MGRKPAAGADEKPFDFASAGQRFNNIDRFCQYWREYPDQDGLKVYLYRISPPIDRRQSNCRDSNIATYTEPAGRDDVLRVFGSGKYQFRFVDQKRPAAHSLMAQCLFDIAEPDCPPIFNPEDLVITGEPAIQNRPLIEKYLSMGWTVQHGRMNTAYVDKKTKEPIPFSSLVPPEPAGAEPAAARPAAEPAKSGEHKDVVVQLVEMIKADADKRAAADPVEKAFEIADRLKPAADPVQVELLKVVTSLVPKPAEHQPQAPGGLRETLGLLKEFGLLPNPGAAASAPAAAPAADPGAGFWSAAFGAVPAVLNFFMAMGARSAMAGHAAGAPARGGFMPAAPGMRGPVPAGGGFMPEASGPVPAGAGGFMPAAGGPVPDGSGMMPAAGGAGDDNNGGNEDMGLFNRLNRARAAVAGGWDMNLLMDLGVDALDAFQRGMSGTDFAHGVCCRRGGEQQYLMLCSLGKQNVMQALGFASSMVEGLPEVLATRRAEVEKFIDDFLSYGNRGGDDAGGSGESAGNAG